MLVVFSVGLNIAFVAVWAVHSFGSHDGHGCGGASGEKTCFIQRELDASDAQMEKLEPIQEEFRASRQQLCRQMHRHRTELLDLVEAGQTDRDAIRAKQDQIAEGQRQMQELVVDHLLAEKQILDSKQQAQLFDLLRSQSHCPGPMSPDHTDGHGPAPF